MADYTPPTESQLMNMKLHEIVEVHQQPYFRIMRVRNGWLYNFYNSEMDDYRNEWVFVPITVF